MDTPAPTTDTAALAANDPAASTMAEHLANAGLPADGQVPAEAAPEIEAKTDDDPAALRARIVALEDELRGHRDLRAQEQDLLSRRNAALHAIEGAKARLTSEKKGLAEVEEQIAALLAQGPGVQTTLFAEEPAAPAPALTPAWADILPAVPPEQVRVVEASAGAELPTVDAVVSALVSPQAMSGEKRAPAHVEAYGAPWLVSALWQEEGTGAVRANILRCYTKDEYSQLHEARFGRAVADFDQSDDARDLRQLGGPWCGLVVKLGRKTYVVGPQTDALHLVYQPAGTAADDRAPIPGPGSVQDEGEGAGEEGDDAEE